MKLLIIGNGFAGTQAAQTVRKLDNTADITILDQETSLFYGRPRLIDYLAGTVSLSQLIVFQQEWYQQNNMTVILNNLVDSLDPINRMVKTDKGEYGYNKLLLAVGAEPNRPPIKGSDQQGIVTLRTMEHAEIIKKTADEKKDICIIGGGLLGLETAGSLAGKDRHVTVIEIGQTLLSKQLDAEKGRHLQSLLENRGITFHLGQVCNEIIKENDKLKIITQSGVVITTGMIVISAGVSARIGLAEKAGLKTAKGIIVNEYLQTSDPNIYAAGDCIEFQGQVWGWVKSASEQGVLAGRNMVLNNTEKFEGSKVDVILKVRDIDLKTL
ncbi:NAD(P)/FAD-dependent oxidoreductase [Thermoproteota archaeon]